MSLTYKFGYKRATSCYGHAKWYTICMWQAAPVTSLWRCLWKNRYAQERPQWKTRSTTIHNYFLCQYPAGLKAMLEPPETSRTFETGNIPPFRRRLFLSVLPLGVHDGKATSPGGQSPHGHIHWVAPLAFTTQLVQDPSITPLWVTWRPNWRKKQLCALQKMGLWDGCRPEKKKHTWSTKTIILKYSKLWNND